jgi:hypothetical protein
MFNKYVEYMQTTNTPTLSVGCHQQFFTKSVLCCTHHMCVQTLFVCQAPRLHMSIDNFPSIVCQQIHLAYRLPSIFDLYRAYWPLCILGDFGGERYHVSDQNMYDRWTMVAIAFCIHVYAERF